MEQQQFFSPESFSIHQQPSADNGIAHYHYSDSSLIRKHQEEQDRPMPSVPLPSLNSYSSSPYAFPYRSLNPNLQESSLPQGFCGFLSPAPNSTEPQLLDDDHKPMHMATNVSESRSKQQQQSHTSPSSSSAEKDPSSEQSLQEKQVKKIATSGQINLTRFLNSGDINNGKAKFSPVRDRFGRKLKLRHYCAVRSCPVTEHSRKPESRQKYRFYRIPPREKDPFRRETWLRAIRPDNPNWDSKWGRVCERHFPTGNPGKCGIPSLFLDPDYPGDLDPHGPISTIKKRKVKSAQETTEAEFFKSNPEPVQHGEEEAQLAIKVEAEADLEESFAAPEEHSPNSGSSPPGFCTMHDDTHLEYLTGRISNFRQMIGHLQQQLTADESELRRLCPDHPLLYEKLEELNNEFEINPMYKGSALVRHATTSKKRKLLPTLRPVVSQERRDSVFRHFFCQEILCH